MRTLSLIALTAAIFASCAGTKEHENLFPHSGDVGAVKIPGSCAFDPATGTYTLTGAGTNMWYTEDEFFMTWLEATGDVTLSADVAFEGQGVNAHRKMGLIIRDGVAPGAVYADVAVHGDGLVSLQYRPAPGAETLESTAQPSGSALPGNISLRRRGDTLYIAATCPSGVSITVATAPLALPETCLVGLFVCSHEADVAETARFSNVTFERP